MGNGRGPVLFNSILLVGGQKGENQICRKNINLEFCIFPHLKKFINMNYLKLDGIMKSEGILCVFHWNVTWLSSEIGTPLSSPLETQGIRWGLITSTTVVKGLSTADLISGCITGSRPKKEHSPGSLLGHRTWDGNVSHHLGEGQARVLTSTQVACGRERDCCHGALLFYLTSRKLQFFLLLSLAV